MKKLLIIVLSLTISLYAGAKPYLNNVGGTYKKVKSYTEIKANDILIFASHSSLDGEDKVRIMTTVSAEYTGRFGYCTYGDYINAMPETITLSEVNSEGKPYEYVVTLGKTGSTTQYLYLQNIDKKYITGDKEQIRTLDLSVTQSKCNVQNNSGVGFYYVGIYVNGLLLRCENDIDDYNGFFCNYNSRRPDNTNDVDIYRKVHEVSFGDTGYSTFYYGNNDVCLPSGVKAYTYQLEDGVLSYSHEYDGDKGDIVPHSTAVVLRGTPNSNAVLDVRNTQTACGYNSVLRGTDTEASTAQDGDASGCRYYMLSNGSKGLGFYYANDNGAAFTNTAHKAYLCLTSDVVATGFTFYLPDGTVTDVRSCKAVKADLPCNVSSGAFYDLFGRRVLQPSGGGLYIQNGRAISVK